MIDGRFDQHFLELFAKDTTRPDRDGGSGRTGSDGQRQPGTGPQPVPTPPPPTGIATALRGWIGRRPAQSRHAETA